LQVAVTDKQLTVLPSVYHSCRSSGHARSAPRCALDHTSSVQFSIPRNHTSR